MRIAVIGATGRIGRVVVQEALARSHEVTAIGRDASRLAAVGAGSTAVADVLDAEAVGKAVSGSDAVVASIAWPREGDVQSLSAAVTVLLEALPRVGVKRLIWVGGGGSLEVEPGLQFMDTVQFPAELLGKAQAQAAALEALRSATTEVEWSYISPPPVQLTDGPRVGRFHVAASDAPLYDADGDSRISIADLACAILDAVEQHQFVGERFTVSY